MLGDAVSRNLHSKIDDISYLNETGCILTDYLIPDKAFVRGFELFMAEEGNLTINVSYISDFGKCTDIFVLIVGLSARETFSLWAAY